MTRRHQVGFTLIEVIIFIVVVGAGLAGILSVYNTAIKSSADPIVRKQSAALADSILEEILQKSYDDPDGLPNTVEGGGRSEWDDVDDYNGKTKADFADWPATLGSYTVNIVVAAAPLGGVNAKRITVTVTGGTHAITMTGYRTPDPVPP
ncbi:MAG: prepilin-type N-terminal cleavage/methylation domain-containing protein [Pseudomonadota bacterium]